MLKFVKFFVCTFNLTFWLDFHTMECARGWARDARALVQWRAWTMEVACPRIEPAHQPQLLQQFLRSVAAVHSGLNYLRLFLSSCSAQTRVCFLSLSLYCSLIDVVYIYRTLEERRKKRNEKDRKRGEGWGTWYDVNSSALLKPVL